MSNASFVALSNVPFLMYWAISLVLLTALAMWIGRLAGLGNLGILIDSRYRYSLTHFQLVLWTLVILSSLLGVFLASGCEAGAVELSAELLGLMGISAASGVLATAVKGSKDAPGSGANVKRGTPPAPWVAPTPGAGPKLAEIWLEEEGDMAGKVISITKYQNFIFTLVILAYYVGAAIQAGGLPALPKEVVWLIGISHAGYVGGKVPNRQ